MWIDTHCHPFAKPFNKDRAEMIQRARDAGVDKMICVGFNPWANRETLKLLEKYDFMYGTLGVHPCDCDELTDEEIVWIREAALARLGRIVGIGETGLDYHHMSHSKEAQQESFRKHIRLAKELNLVCIVHSRDAADDTLRILLEEKAEKVVFHCYSYGLEFAKQVWAEGFYTSFSGVVTYPQAADVQEAAKHAPADLILIETDCPYLAPQSIRGKRNEISGVVEVGEKVAELRAMQPQQLATQLSSNFQTCFMSS